MKRVIFSFLLVLLFSQVAYSSSYDLHHIFPRSMSGYFNSIGINPDLWCILLKRSDHMGAQGRGIHTMRFIVTGGLNYVDSWKMFAVANPDGPSSACFAFASLLLSEYGLKGKIKVLNYLTKTETGKEINVGSRLINGILTRAKLLAPRIAKNIALLFIAFEAFNFACAADDIFPDEEFIRKAEDAFLESTNIYESNPQLASKKLAQAYLYLAISVFSKEMEAKNDFHKEIISRFSNLQEERLRISIFCLERSVRIAPDDPFSQLFYSEALFWNKDYSTSLDFAQKALRSFSALNDQEMIRFSNSLISRIKGANKK